MCLNDKYYNMNVCSFGEVVDKMTILKIKQTKAIHPIALSNIEKELTTIINRNTTT